MTELYNIGDMIEVAWEYSNPRGLFKPTRTIRMILLDPIYEKESRYPLRSTSPASTCDGYQIMES